jgi:hypothetical protein
VLQGVISLVSRNRFSLTCLSGRADIARCVGEEKEGIELAEKQRK